jgi:hypothetical protein
MYNSKGYISFIKRWVLFVNALAILLVLSKKNTYAQEIRVTPVKIGKGSENTFASSYQNGYLYFCTDKIEKTKQQKTNVINEHANFLNIYRVKISHDGIIAEKPIRLDDSINSRFNEGPISFSSSGNMSYFSSNVFLDPTDSTLQVSLYKAAVESNAFSQRQLIDELVVKGVNLAHPALFHNDEMLIFVSDDKSGKGKADLYYSYQINGKWSDPVNMDFINTEHSETFPTVFNNRLYFASDRPGGLGGLDIYVTSFQNGKWITPKLLPAPINSSADDFLFIPIDGKKGFLSSNRVNEQDRIFTFNYLIPSIDRFTAQKIDSCFTFNDENSENRDDLIYQWKIDGKVMYETASFSHCFPGIGKYQVSCDIIETSVNKIHELVDEITIDISYTLPLIDLKKESENQLRLICNQTYSEKTYKNWYWRINNINYFEESPTVDIEPILDIKLVLWNSEKDVTGINYLYQQNK